MGMFDNVDYKMKCLRCGAPVERFQSQDGPCCLATLDYLDVNNFYSHCPKCEAWIEFTRKKALSIDDYDMLITERE